jgi:hypothetical protein
MIETVARQWVEALRSGKYAQTKNVLNRVDINETDSVDSFCCLGVLCVLYESAGNEMHHELRIEKADDNAAPVLCRTSDMEWANLPCTVTHWSGMRTEDGTLSKVPPELIPENLRKYLDDSHPSLNTLVEVNDKGASFEEIADLIEKAFEYL